MPRRLPRCCLRCLTFFGASIRRHPPAAPRAPRASRRGVSACGVSAPAPGSRPRHGRLGHDRISTASRRLGDLRGPADGRVRPATGRPPPQRPAKAQVRFAGRQARSASAGSDARASERALGRLFAIGDLVAVVDPDLHADLAERGLGLGGAVVDLRAERVQRHAALAVPLATRHLGAAQPATGLHPDAQGAGAHGGLHGSTHRAAEGDTTDELLGDALRQQRGVGLGPRLAGGLVHVLDLHVDPLLGEALDVLAQADRPPRPCARSRCRGGPCG